MWPFRTAAAQTSAYSLPLFPLRTVLFPGGLLPLKVFEQRYVDMTKACMMNSRPFGVCLIMQGEEVATPSGAPPEIATVGTLARITDWDMPQLGILHVATIGETRFQVRKQSTQPNGLVVGEVTPIDAEAAQAARDESFKPLAQAARAHRLARRPAATFPPSAPTTTRRGSAIASPSSCRCRCDQAEHARDQRRGSAPQGAAEVPGAAGSTLTLR